MTLFLRPQPCLPRRLFAALASLALGGCSLFGGQTGQDTAFSNDPCNKGPSSVATDAVSVIGISADDLLAALPPLGGRLHIHRPDQVDNLTLSLSGAAAARQVAETNGSCRNKLEVDALATLLTDDGLFNANLPVTLEAEASNSWRLQGKRRLSEIAGSYDWSVFPLNQWQDPSLQVQAQTSAGGGAGPAVTGSLSLVGDDPDPADGATPVAAAVGEWMSAGPGSFGGSGGTAEFGGMGGGNGSLGGAGGTAGGVNSSGGTSSGGTAAGAGGAGGG